LSDRKRILQVFKSDKIPEVSNETLEIYCKYIRKNLTLPCSLTGIESMGYFSWEERYLFGYGDKKEYENIRKREGSYKDNYELRKFISEVIDDWDILVKVIRKNDKKKFEIPLSELEVIDKKSPDYQLLNDYTIWRVNW
jgi:hypothetical protein